MLDGYNLNKNDYKRKRNNGLPVYKEHWVDLNENDFTFLKYEQKERKKIIEQIITDFKKTYIYRDLYIKEIPELSLNIKGLFNYRDFEYI